MDLSEEEQNAMASRREHARLMLSLPASLHPIDGMESMPTRLLDISRSGAGIVHGDRLQSGSQHILHFVLPGEADPCEIRLEIVYCAPIGETNQYRCGARFQPLTQNVEDRLFDFLTRPKAF
ncbi:PilZ domain-containing protein [Pseudoduganella sp. RAF53_2]|uniref:PilZ domain-containing protein n=1 Tax=unclassified Pseudoduganella TaxID=2637179 RepID=UPI003F9AF9A6